MLELDLESRFQTRVLQRGGMSWHVNPCLGFPDRLVALPDRGLELVELKRDASTGLKKHQMAFRRRLGNLGVDVAIVRSPSDIEEYLRGLR